MAWYHTHRPSPWLLLRFMKPWRNSKFVPWSPFCWGRKIPFGVKHKTNHIWEKPTSKMKGLVRFRCFFLEKKGWASGSIRLVLGAVGIKYPHTPTMTLDWNTMISLGHLQIDDFLLPASREKTFQNHGANIGFFRFIFMVGSWPFKTTTKNTRNHNQQPIQLLMTYSNDIFNQIVWDILEKNTPPRWHWWRIGLDFQEKHHGTTESLPMSKPIPKTSYFKQKNLTIPLFARTTLPSSPKAQWCHSWLSMMDLVYLYHYHHSSLRWSRHRFHRETLHRRDPQAMKDLRAHYSTAWDSHRWK